MKPRCLLLCILIGLTSIAESQTDSVNTRKRVALVAGIGVAGYAGSMVFLNDLWYKDFPRSSFHFFNDNKEWQQMDKVGHGVSAFWTSSYGIDAMRWTGISDKKAILYGGLYGTFFLTTIEVLDGFSAGWGASAGDLIANTAGSLLAVGQELIWNEKRFQLKYSFHTSDFAQYRPDVLGKNFAQQLLKDYNGQSYWLSCNLKSWLPPESKFPDWLHIAFGYGASGMIGATDNVMPDGREFCFSRYRRYFLSVDVDPSRIKTNKRFLKLLFKSLSVIKIPAPALELSRKRMHGHLLYY
ncbi:MAG: YfiM family protein [Bacteroidetes bacterium]|nr:YfiM family protein [Bacteroidota bacterium]MBU1719862.1 YfiM family protein [Bacteroidota bacterium]